MEERLQKILSRAGYGSRRACEELILAGRVRVNGQVAELGSKADGQKDRITMDGKIISAPEELVYIALHKPRNVLSTTEAPDPRPTVLDLVPVSSQVYPVGRLDFESEGLILLTNDGDLANRLTHPRYGHQKEYRVLVARQPDMEQLDAFRHGVVLEDGRRTAPADVRIEKLFGKGAWMNVVLREGRKRQIRETCVRLGLPVVRIIRVRIGSLRLGTLKPREWRYLTPDEVQSLKEPQSTKSAVQKDSLPGRRAKSGSSQGKGQKNVPASEKTSRATRSPRRSSPTQSPYRKASVQRKPSTRKSPGSPGPYKRTKKTNPQK